MSASERLAFHRDPVRPAMLSTVRADGRPHVPGELLVRVSPIRASGSKAVAL